MAKTENQMESEAFPLYCEICRNALYSEAKMRQELINSSFLLSISDVYDITDTEVKEMTPRKIQYNGEAKEADAPMYYSINLRRNPSSILLEDDIEKQVSKFEREREIEAKEVLQKLANFEEAIANE